VICSVFLLFSGLAGAQLLRDLFCNAGKQFSPSGRQWNVFEGKYYYPDCKLEYVPGLIDSAVACAGYMATQMTLLEHNRADATFRAQYGEWEGKDMHWDIPCEFKDNAVKLDFQSRLAKRLAIPIERHFTKRGAFLLPDPLAPPPVPSPPVVEELIEGIQTLRVTIGWANELPAHVLSWNPDGMGGFFMQNSAVRVTLHWLTEEEKKGSDAVVCLKYDMPGRDGQMAICA